jgi:Ca2+-binding RTX toxin-like protein
MATIKYFAGRPQHDWEVILQDVLANGTFSTIGTTETQLTITIGDRQVIVTGTGLMATAARTIDAGAITAIAIREAGQAVMSVTGLASTTAADLQTAINGAGGLEPYSEQFKDVAANLVTGEFFIATGSAASDTILGTARIDNLNGGAGDDYMRGGASVDTLVGGAGRDFLAYYFDPRTVGIKIDLATSKVVNNNAGAATVDRISGFEIVHGTRFADVMNGSSGNNDLYGAHGNDLISGRDGNDFLEGWIGNDKLYGGNGNDQLYGNEGADYLSGGNGNDLLRGDEGGTSGQGSDRLYGGAGNDRFKGGWGADYIDGGTGDEDFILYNDETNFTGDNATHGVIVNLSSATLTGVSVVGISTRNVAAGTAIDTRNFVDTIRNVERINGTGYNDLIVGSSGDDELQGQGGNDKILGGAGNDGVHGGDGNNTLYGGSGNDFMTGGSGRTTFVGGLGFDTIDCGEQVDRVVYNAKAECGDEIPDFSTEDILVFKGSEFGGLDAGFISASMFITRNNHVARDSNDHFIYDTSNSTIWYDSNGVGAGGLTLVCKFDPNTLGLTAGNILIV